MALVDNITNWEPIPHEEGNEFLLRKLTWKQLERAADARADRSAPRVRAVGGEVMAALQTVKRDDLDEGRENPLNTYDRGTLLEMGVANWRGPLYEKDFKKESIEQLDSDTADWAATRLVEMSKKTKTKDQQRD